MKLRFKSLRDVDAEEGTAILVDDRHQFKDKKGSDIALIPQPSDDVNDPLNWPKWRRVVAFVTICFYAFLAGWVLGGITIGIPPIMNEFNVDLNSAINGLISWCVFTLGIGNFLWTPTALYFGKRPVYLFASFVSFAAVIWCAEAKDFRSFVAARVVSALMFAASEGLTAAISADIFFLHERGLWTGLYLISLMSGVSLGGLMSGFIITALGWRWHFWIGAIFTGVDALAILFFFPETQFSRPTDVKPDDVVSSDTPEKAVGNNNLEELKTSPEVTMQEGPLSAPKSYFQLLKPYSAIDRSKNYLILLLRPVPIILYPAVIFSFLTFASTLGFLIAALTTCASVFQNPPYNFSPAINGLINIPSFIGNLLGSYCGGGLTDIIAERQARRNSGIFEPEARLVALIIPFFLVPAGLLMYAFGVDHKTHWALPYVGYGLISFGLTAIPSITMTYILDAYLPVGFEAILLVNALKQIFAFGFSYGVVPWVTLDGFPGAFGAMAGIQIGLTLFGLPLWYYGKQIRHKSGGWKIILY